jgi:AcrR family transcriptional regulator
MAEPRKEMSMRQEERSGRSQAKLLRAARELFTANGYAATSLDEIAGVAGLTKGAVYHQFADKKALFRAVFEAVDLELIERLKRAPRSGDAWRDFRHGCADFLRACVEPAFQRILLRDGPAVLGWNAWHEVDEPYSNRLLVKGLERARAQGRIRLGDVEPLAMLIKATLCESARYVASASDGQAALERVLAALDMLLGGLEQPVEADARP